jgi:hypothetical protein
VLVQLLFQHGARRFVPPESADECIGSAAFEIREFLHVIDQGITPLTMPADALAQPDGQFSASHLKPYSLHGLLEFEWSCFLFDGLNSPRAHHAGLLRSRTKYLERRDDAIVQLLA